MSLKFYVCQHCGNIVTFVKDAGVPVMCCGEKMSELIPGTSDGAHEKHVPVVEAEGKKITVKVGEAEHPMLEAHWIQWIALETEGQPDQISEPRREAGGSVYSQRGRRGSGSLRVLQPSRTLEEGDLK